MSTRLSLLHAWTRELRVHQWAKNSLVFVPLVVGHAYDAQSIRLELLAFWLVCLIASATYIVNDLIDLEADKTHLTKRERPFASGQLDTKWGFFLAPTMIVTALFGAL